MHTPSSLLARDHGLLQDARCALLLCFLCGAESMLHIEILNRADSDSNKYIPTPVLLKHTHFLLVFTFSFHISTQHKYAENAEGHYLCPGARCFQCHKSSSCCTPTAIKTLVSLNYIVIWVHACCWSTMDRNLRYFLTPPIFQVPWLSFKMLEMWGEESGL